MMVREKVAVMELLWHMAHSQPCREKSSFFQQVVRMVQGLCVSSHHHPLLLLLLLLLLMSLLHRHVICYRKYCWRRRRQRSRRKVCAEMRCYPSSGCRCWTRA